MPPSSVIDKSFGFDTAVEEAQRAINVAHIEVESVENGVGIVKLMGRYSGFIAMHATLASRDVVRDIKSFTLFTFVPPPSTQTHTFLLSVVAIYMSRLTD
ncbi:hypothetical protein ACS0TY_017554 [Phlomoides rotata]